ncbi:MAG: Bifunctional primase/polymerase [Gemmataceae bacterium]|nr:Bifunctional primase/polymerase [Gemmataceae bacterium]
MSPAGEPITNPSSATDGEGSGEQVVGHDATSASEPPPTRQDYYQLALEFRAFGLSVFPLRRNKCPAARWKQFQRRPPTDRQITRMFDAASVVGGVGLVLGRPFAAFDEVLACRDFDSLLAYRAWAESHPELAATLPTVLTPRPGRHVYVRLRGPERFVKFADGDLRADRGHYVCLPPTRHPNGGYYRWWNTRPGSLRDFPVIDIEQSGFLQTRTGRTVSKCGFRSSGRDNAGRRRMSVGTAVESPPGLVSQSEHRADDSQKQTNGLCPNSPGPDLAELPPQIREAVLRTLPMRVGERNDCLLRLARALLDIDPARPAAGWEGVVRVWWMLAHAAIGTKAWCVTWGEFTRAWDRAEVPISGSLPKRAMRAGASTSGDLLKRLRDLCRALASVTGGTFFLSCRDAAAATNRSKSAASRALARLVLDGFVVTVRLGARHPRLRRATEYSPGPCWNADGDDCRADLELRSVATATGSPIPRAAS